MGRRDGWRLGNKSMSSRSAKVEGGRRREKREFEERERATGNEKKRRAKEIFLKK